MSHPISSQLLVVSEALGPLCQAFPIFTKASAMPKYVASFLGHEVSAPEIAVRARETFI
jgi:hypothetical protein